MSHKSHSYFSVSSSRAPIRNTADYSPFGIQLDGRTLAYVPPAPAPPSVTVVYQHKFDDNPSTHPYTTAPNQLNTKLTNVNWTNSQSSWTNFAGFTGKALATNSATPDTTRLYLNLSVNSGFMLDVKSYSFYHRSSTTGYTNYQLLVNGVLVGSGSIFVSSGSTLQSTGTINVGNAVAGLTGSVTVTLKLFGGSNGNNATFRLDDFTLNGYTQEVQVYAESYRYGFQNQEKDDEIKGAGNSVNYTFRMHDPRIGRFFAVDPLMRDYPWNSAYAFSENRINDCVELEGKEAFWIHGTKSAWGFSYSGVNSKQMLLKDIKRIGQVLGNTSFDNTFNWSGANSDEERHKAAVDLANHVISTRKKLIKEGKITENEPISLIGQSHGGNVSIEATNILIEKHGIEPKLIKITALNTPREHDIVLWEQKVELYSVNANDDRVQAHGGDGSLDKNSDVGGIHVLFDDIKIFYNDKLKKDKIGYLIESNHNGWHEKNINVWLPKLEKEIKEKK